MKTLPFKAGDKVKFVTTRADTTIYCVSRVTYQPEFNREKPNFALCSVTLVGKPNPPRFPEGWPGKGLRLVWSSQKATR